MTSSYTPAAATTMSVMNVTGFSAGEIIIAKKVNNTGFNDGRGKATYQSLDEANIIILLAQAYDLIAPYLSPEERNSIEQNFFILSQHINELLYFWTDGQTSNRLQFGFHSIEGNCVS